MKFPTFPGAVALLVLAACKGSDTETDSTDTESADTETTDSDTDITIVPGPQDVTLTLELGVAAGASWRVGAFEYTATGDADGITVGAEAVSAPVAGTVALTLEVPTSTPATTIYGSGTRFAFVMYDDANANAAYDAGETIEGGAQRGGVEFVGTTGTGRCAGQDWCGVHFETGFLRDVLPAADDFTFELHDLHMQPTMLLSGTVEAGYLYGNPRFVMLSLINGVGDPTEVDEPAYSPFAITIGEPDEARTQDPNGYGFEYAHERFTAYLDTDDDRVVDSGEQTDLDYCPITRLLWADPIDATNLDIATRMSLHGWHPGWQAVDDFTVIRIIPDNGTINGTPEGLPMKYWYYCGG